MFKIHMKGMCRNVIVINPILELRNPISISQILPTNVKLLVWAL